MPGFVLGIDADDSAGNVPIPTNPIYNFTWSLNALVGSNIRPDGNDPLVYAKDVTLPDFSVDVDEMLGSSLKYKYAKSVTFNDIKITLYATGTLLAELEAKKSTVWTPENGIQPANNYKFDSTIEQRFADDQTVANTWTLHGSWIKGISHTNLTYTNSDVHNVIVTLAYDWATVK